MEENKKGKGKNVLIVFLVIIVLGLAGYISYDKYFYKYFEKENVKVEKKETKKSKLTDLDIDSKEVKDLHEKLVDEVNFHDSGSVYNSFKTDVNNLPIEALLSLVISDIKFGSETDNVPCSEILENGAWEKSAWKNDTCSGESSWARVNISTENIKKGVINIIGREQEKNYKYESFSLNGDGALVCAYYNNNYSCYDAQGGGTEPDFGESKIIKATKDQDDNIYIYDKYLMFKTDENSNELVYHVYNTFDKKKELNQCKDIDGNNDCNYENYIKIYGNDDINTFKHTFKKDIDGNYYWYSTEIVEK